MLHGSTRVVVRAVALLSATTNIDLSRNSNPVLNKTGSAKLQSTLCKDRLI